MLDQFITLNRDDIIARCRRKVLRRSTPPPDDAEINHGVPIFLDQFVAALRSKSSNSLQMDATAGQHGHDLLLQGLTVSQVVHDYGDVCQAITDLAIETDAPISTEDFRKLNRCLDEAIASAVTTYQRESHPPTADRISKAGPDRLHLLMQELRSLIGTAVVAFDVLKTGNVGVGGSTGTVLNRSLIGSRDLIMRAMDEARLTSSDLNKAPTHVAEFIKEIGDASDVEARAHGVKLQVSPVLDGLMIDVDRPILTAVMAQLLKNAFTFTRAGSRVTLAVDASADRIRLEVQDECGGRLGADEREAHSIDPSSADRPGLGIGLAFCRSGAEVNGGRLDVRNRAKGCVYAVDLPRLTKADSMRVGSVIPSA